MDINTGVLDLVRFSIGMMAAVAIVINAAAIGKRLNAFKKLSPVLLLLAVHTLIFYVITEYAIHYHGFVNPACGCTPQFTVWSLFLRFHSALTFLYVSIVSVRDNQNLLSLLRKLWPADGR